MLPAPAKRPPSQDAIEEALTLPGDAYLPVKIDLADSPAFDFGEFQGADDTKRADLVAARQAQLAASQENVEALLVAKGAKNLSRLWISNTIFAEVPAKHVAALASDTRVRAVVPNNRPVRVGTAYDGNGHRNGMRTSAFVNAGITGSAGNRLTGTNAIRIGVIDKGFPDRTHVAFKTGGGTFGISRIAKIYDCRVGGACVITSAAGTGANHGHRVSVAALASLEREQDPAFLGSFTSDQTARSGAAPDARLYYYEVNFEGDVDVALNKALADGVDITNMSIGFDSPSVCNAGFISSTNTVLADTLAGGITHFACGGNDPAAPGAPCAIWYPGLRSETVAVAPLDTWDNTVAYDTVPMGRFGASKGGMQLTSWDGYTNSFFTTAGIDISAPSDMTLHANSGPATYQAADTAGGCSFATPRAAGTAALMKHAFRTLGYTLDARFLMLATIITGDAWNGENPGSKTTIGVSDRSGFGRIHAHWPSSTNLVSPWAWGWRSLLVGPNQEVCWDVGTNTPEPAAATHWKWAGMYFEPNLNAVADLDTRVYNACAGVPRTLMYSDSGYDLRMKAQLRGSDVAGKCLQMCVYGYSVPPGQTRMFYSMDYYHGGNADDH